MRIFEIRARVRVCILNQKHRTLASSALLGALGAAADASQMKVEVFFSVVIGKLFARLDCSACKDVNVTIAEPDFAIGSAGVIDEASRIRRNVSIDHALVARPEEILATIVPHLFGSGGTPKVFDHE